MRESPTGPCNINTKVGIVTALIAHRRVQPRGISGTRPSSDNRSNVTSAGTVKIDLFSPNCQFTLPRPMTNEWDHIGGILNIPRILRQIFLLLSGQINKAKQIKRNGGESRMQIKFLSSPNSWQKSLKIRELQAPANRWCKNPRQEFFNLIKEYNQQMHKFNEPQKQHKHKLRLRYIVAKLLKIKCTRSDLNMSSEGLSHFGLRAISHSFQTPLHFYNYPKNTH